ncbi:MAG TPA: phage virion morphogenesis protein [Rariglobus sp.]|jgi:phage gpG-like protein|nr:phage virion morphogenesis protein [Rariglobus sp.]
MSVQLRDTLSPALAWLARGVRHPKAILEAMGTQLESLTKRAFNEPSLRPAPWKNKWDGSPATLRKNQLLVRSIRITALTDTSVTVGTDRIYAAIHQFGGVIKAKGKALRLQLGNRTLFVKQVTIPARPFFPWLNGRMTPLALERIQKTGERKIASLVQAQGHGGEA